MPSRKIINQLYSPKQFNPCKTFTVPNQEVKSDFAGQIKAKNEHEVNLLISIDQTSKNILDKFLIMLMHQMLLVSKQS